MSSIPEPSPIRTARKPTGLALWMTRVLEECDRARVALDADPVHDLRVALRRCRSLADGIMVMDTDPAWKQMKKAGKRLFGRLGELRDAHVMEEWIRRLGSPDDPVTLGMLQFLSGREAQLKQDAAEALEQFDVRQWRRWSASLPRRAARIRPGSALFKHLALERWTEARKLHQGALRNRSQLAWHRLRIGIKRFRYIVENFLPEEHTAWSAGLKELQDLLGEVHDLDVLQTTLLQANALAEPDSRLLWLERIARERTWRIDKYRKTMLGNESLWQTWRAGLPYGREIESAALGRLKLWASRLDPDFKHSLRVARLALQLYDGLARTALPNPGGKNQRSILQVAALLHDVGRSKAEKGHHKASHKLVTRLAPPMGWSMEKMRIAGIVARYHRGSLPAARHSELAGLSVTQRQEVAYLAAILRLANAFDSGPDGKIQRVKVNEHNGVIWILAQGYSARDRRAERIAGARHLLEVVTRRPVMVKALRAP
jgi:CHAD domain-containing protein/HD superfamily phosphodiesterase